MQRITKDGKLAVVIPELDARDTILAAAHSEQIFVNA
jgi:hypothetical protein